MKRLICISTLFFIFITVNGQQQDDPVIAYAFNAPHNLLTQRIIHEQPDNMPCKIPVFKPKMPCLITHSDDPMPVKKWPQMLLSEKRQGVPKLFFKKEFMPKYILPNK